MKEVLWGKNTLNTAVLRTNVLINNYLKEDIVKLAATKENHQAKFKRKKCEETNTNNFTLKRLTGRKEVKVQSK